MSAPDPSAPDPRGNPILLGHGAAEAALAEAARGGRLHHAWLLAGPPGIGKATLAFRFARWLLAGGVESGQGTLALDPAHPVFRRVAAGGHPDLLTVARGHDEKRNRPRAEIVAEEARAIPAFMHLTPAEGGWRVVVVDGAEHLNRHAANALLKILEEPPRRAVLLLACAAPGRLLPTLRSRCRTLRLRPLPDPEMRTLLARFLPELDEAARRELAGLAEGSPGRALELAGADGLAVAALAREAMGGIALLRAYEMAEALGRMDDGFGSFVELLRAGIAAKLRREATDAMTGAASLDARSLDAWGRAWQGLGRLRDETERFNLDKRQATVSGLALLPCRTGN